MKVFVYTFVYTIDRLAWLACKRSGYSTPGKTQRLRQVNDVLESLGERLQASWRDEFRERARNNIKSGYLAARILARNYNEFEVDIDRIPIEGEPVVP
jgi:hypothetical protein